MAGEREKHCLKRHFRINCIQILFVRFKTLQVRISFSSLLVQLLALNHCSTLKRELSSCTSTAFMELCNILLIFFFFTFIRLPIGRVGMKPDWLCHMHSHNIKFLTIRFNFFTWSLFLILMYVLLYYQNSFLFFLGINSKKHRIIPNCVTFLAGTVSCRCEI